MRFSLFRAPAGGEIRKPRWRRFPALLSCALAILLPASMSFAQQNSAPSRPPGPIISPEANPLPDKNEQMMMRERNLQRRNFDAANTERLKQVEQASKMLETMAIALEAEVEKSGDPSQNTLHKAETIEKLAHIVKERMTLTVGPE